MSGPFWITTHTASHHQGHFLVALCHCVRLINACKRSGHLSSALVHLAELSTELLGSPSLGHRALSQIKHAGLKVPSKENSPSPQLSLVKSAAM